MDNVVNVTNNFSPWQVAATVIACVGAFFLVANYIRTKLFQFMKDWQISQLEMQNAIALKQEELKTKIDSMQVAQDKLQDCIHSIPGHPENPKNGGTN